MTVFPSRRAFQSLGLLLIAAALLLRLAVPQGWMPSADGKWITFCSGMGIETLWLDSEGQRHDDAPANGESSPCAFAGLGAALDVPDQQHAVRPQFPDYAAVFVPSTRSAIGHGLAAPPPPQTGPPTLI
jgi:hypothetical protein